MSRVLSVIGNDTHPSRIQKNCLGALMEKYSRHFHENVSFFFTKDINWPKDIVLHVTSEEENLLACL